MPPGGNGDLMPHREGAGALTLDSRHDMPGSPRPIVLIGAGGIVRGAHLPAYRLAGFPVAGIADVRVERAHELAREYAIPRVSGSVAEAVRAAPHNAVFDVAVPASELPRVIGAFPRGAGVLIQKPLGEDLDQAKRLVDVCRERGYVAAVNFQLRYAPQLIAARRLIASGRVGDVHDIEVRIVAYTPWHLWDFLESCPRMEILYHSIHYVDLIRSFLGDPGSIQARTVKHPAMMNMASTRTNIIMDYGEVIRANVTTNHGHGYGVRHQESYVKIEGTRGAVFVQLGLMLDYPAGREDVCEYCLLDDEPPTWTRVDVEGSWYPHAFVGTMASLMRKLEDPSRELPTSVDDALRTMACVEAAYAASDRRGVPVQTT